MRYLRKRARDALPHEEGFLATSFGETEPLSEKEFEKVLGLVSDWGVETSSDEIDQILYGARRSRRKR